MTDYTHFRHKTWLTLGLTLGLVLCGFASWRVRARESQPPLRNHPSQSSEQTGKGQALAGVLNADGTVRTGMIGSFDARESLVSASMTPCSGTMFSAVTNIGPVLARSVAVGDFNLDGKSDLATADSIDHISVLLGNGLGSFGTATNFVAGEAPFSVAVGDFNLDTKPDLAVANFYSENVSVLLGDGTGSFGQAMNFVIGDGPVFVAVGDFNLDNKPDLVLANQHSNNISVLLGNGTGSFSAATNYSVGPSPESVAIGDFNLDGKPDLVVTNWGSSSVSVLLGNGVGGFGTATDFYAGPSSAEPPIPVSVAVGDFNLDGKPDLAVGTGPRGNVSVLLGDGGGSFGKATNFGTGSVPYSMVMSDFNMDGKPDLAAANTNSDSVSVLLGNGTGGFGAAINFGVGHFPTSVVVGDFNLDSKPDLAVANPGSRNISVLLHDCNTNTPPTIIPIDITRTAGSPSANSQIAVAMDLEDPRNKLQISVKGQNSPGFTNSAMSNGVVVTLSDLNENATGSNPDAMGNVFADVVATCAFTSPAFPAFTLRVTDSSGLLIMDRIFYVLVNNNTAPVLAYKPTSVFAGGSILINPATGPSDNGTVKEITLYLAGTLTGTVKVNNVTGIVTISNAAPVGKHNIVIFALDNCGVMTTAQFILTVDAPPALGSRLADPLDCTGPGDVLKVTATVTNPNAFTVNVDFTATPSVPGQLLVIDGSCTSTGQLSGTCTTNAPTQVRFTGQIAAGQTVTLNYRVKVADNVTSGTSLCTTSTASFNNGPTRTIQACTTINCPYPGPGTLAATTSPLNSQRPGSVLIYNVFTSSAAAPNQQNTRLSLTNTHPLNKSYVHLFFVDGASCSVADGFVCLTPNQTTSFLASDLDPGTSGYVIAVAVDALGCPSSFNYLIGDEFVKFNSGHAANLGAEAVTAIAGGLPFCDGNTTTTELRFDGLSYSVLPTVLAADNLGSRADGNETLLILNRIGGSLATGAATLGSVFGILYDDAEAPVSFSFTAGTCQLRNVLSSSFPRTVPRYEQFIPAGRSGWLKVSATNLGAMTGAVLNANPNALTQSGAFNQGHNLHKLTTTNTAAVTIPVFPPGC